jgi:hypothetical protein
VANGKGGDLIRFLNDTGIPKDKRPSLLGTSGLCSAVIKGKGGDLIRFLDDAYNFRKTSGHRSWVATACAAP